MNVLHLNGIHVLRLHYKALKQDFDLALFAKNLTRIQSGTTDESDLGWIWEGKKMQLSRSGCHWGEKNDTKYITFEQKKN